MEKYEIEISENRSQENLPYYLEVQTYTFSNTFAPPHIQNYGEIFYCTKGKIEVRLNNKVFEINEGEMVFILPNIFHVFRTPLETADCYTLKFDMDYIHSVPKRENRFEQILTFIPLQYLIFSAEELKENGIDKIFEQIYYESTHKPFDHHFALKLCYERLFLYVLRSLQQKCPEAFMNTNISSKNKINSIIDYISTNYNAPLSANEVAKDFYMSYSALSKAIKSATDMSFKQYLNFVRIAQAKKMLMETNLNITEIAQLCGFCTTSFFIEQFKSYEGLSPKKYRDLRNKKADK